MYCITNHLHFCQITVMELSVPEKSQTLLGLKLFKKGSLKR